MQIKKTKLFIFLSLSLIFCHIPLFALNIVTNGKSDYSIVGDSKDPAVKELQSYIKKMSNATLPIIPKNTNPLPEKAIIVGDNNAAILEKSALGLQAYRLKISGKRLLIIGGGADGISNGIYGLLDDHWGCKFLTIKEDFIPTSPTLSLPNNLDEVKKPSIRDSQWIMTGGLMDNKDWRRRNRMTFEKKGYATHNLFQLLPPEKYFNDHPDWYPLGKDGVRKNNFAWLCWSNQEMQKELTNVLKKKMAKTPANQYISVGQGDGFKNPCNCPKCRACVEKYGSEIAPLVRGLNNILKETSKEFPKHEIVTFAYYATLSPPIKGDDKIIPHPNLCLTFVRTGDAMKNIESGTNSKGLKTSLLNWLPLTTNLQVWSWSVGFKNSLCPFPNYKAMGEDTKWYAEHGIQGLMHQMYGKGEWYVLRQWLLARIMWDSSLDIKETEKEFLRCYYGKNAAKPLWSIIDKMQKKAETTPKQFNAVFGSNPKYVRENLFPPEEIEFYQKAFEQAIAAAEKSGDPLYPKRVKDTMARSFSMLLFADPAPMKKVTIEGKDWMLPNGDARLALPAVTLSEVLKRTIMWEWFGPELGRRKFMNNAGGPMEVVENEKIKLGFCPALDGILCSLIDKENNTELLRIGPAGKGADSGIRHMIFSSSAADHEVNIETTNDIKRVTLSGPVITWSWMVFKAFRHDRVFELPKNRSGFTIKSYIYADSKNPAFALYNVHKNPSMRNVLNEAIYDPHVTMRFGALQPDKFQMLAISPKGAQLYKFNNSKTIHISLPKQREPKETLTLYFSGVIPDKMLSISTSWKDWNKITVELNPDTQSFLLKFDGPKIACKKDIKTLYGSFEVDILSKEELQKKMPVEKLLVKSENKDSPTLEWKTKTFQGFAGYHIYASKGQEPFKRLTDKPLIKSFWTPKKPLTNDRWRFQVTVVGKDGEGVASPFVCWRNLKSSENSSTLLVANNGTGDFTTIQDAFDALPKTKWTKDIIVNIVDTSSEIPNGYDGAQVLDETIKAAKNQTLHIIALKGKTRIHGAIDLNGSGKATDSKSAMIKTEIRGFRFISPAKSGIEAPGYGSIITENEFIQLKKGIVLESYKHTNDIMIERNFFYNNEFAIMAVNIGAIEKQPMIIRNNIFVSSGIYLNSGANTYIIHNTFDDSSLRVEASLGFTIANNIFAYKTPLHMVRTPELYMDKKQVIDGNIFHHTTPLVRYGKEQINTLEEWKKIGHGDDNNRQAAPLWMADESMLTEKSSKNIPQLQKKREPGKTPDYYKLRPDSPCHNGGIGGLPIGDVDFFGNKRTNSDNPGVGASIIKK